MFCPKCGTDNPANAEFCGSCGAPLTARDAVQPAMNLASSSGAAASANTTAATLKPANKKKSIIIAVAAVVVLVVLAVCINQFACSTKPVYLLQSQTIFGSDGDSTTFTQTYTHDEQGFTTQYSGPTSTTDYYVLDDMISVEAGSTATYETDSDGYLTKEITTDKDGDTRTTTYEYYRPGIIKSFSRTYVSSSSSSYSGSSHQFTYTTVFDEDGWPIETHTTYSGTSNGTETYNWYYLNEFSEDGKTVTHTTYENPNYAGEPTDTKLVQLDEDGNISSVYSLKDGRQELSSSSVYVLCEHPEKNVAARARLKFSRLES